MHEHSCSYQLSGLTRNAFSWVTIGRGFTDRSPPVVAACAAEVHTAFMVFVHDCGCLHLLHARQASLTYERATRGLDGAVAVQL